jgi:hypothetical protein
MATLAGEITNYEIELYSKATSGLGANITCLTTSGALVIMRFWKEGTPTPENTTTDISSGDKRYYLGLRYHEFARVVDLLRNEKPIWYSFQEERKWGSVRTTSEPVGEEESP